MTELGESAGGFSILGFLNMGEVPIMFYASIVALCMWVNSVKMNQWFNPDGSTWFALALAIPNLMFAVLLAKVLLEPVKIYNRKRQRTSSLVGKVCVVKSQEINEGFGRCEVATDSAPIIVNARTENGEVLKQGDPAVIVRQLPEQGFHIVTKQNLE
jgi:membrane protein implicated in regulation of membrane protease activity